MEFRRANEKDIPALVENRLEFVQLIRKIENIDNVREATVKYLEEHIAKDDMVIFIKKLGFISLNNQMKLEIGKLFE